MRRNRDCALQFSGCCARENQCSHSRRREQQIPLRAAEQRRRAGGSRRGLSESSRAFCEGEFRSRPARRVAQGSPKGRRTGGRLLWVTFLGGARKVTSCRAAPGEVDAGVSMRCGAIGLCPRYFIVTYACYMGTRHRYRQDQSHRGNRILTE